MDGATLFSDTTPVPNFPSKNRSFYARYAWFIMLVAVVLVGVIADAAGMRHAFLVCAAVGFLGAPFVVLLPTGMKTAQDT